MSATENTSFIPTPGYNMNPMGSQYAETFSHEESRLLREAIEYQIFDLAPRQFDPLKIINMLPMMTKPSDEFTYVEKVWTRNPLEVASYTHGTKTITLAGTYASEDDLHLQVNHKLYASENEEQWYY
jgi:hypothetical protein